MSPKAWVAAILGALVVLGALLRLWGVNWPPLHPDEWTVRIVRHLYEGNLYFAHRLLWHEFMFGVLGILYWPVNLVITFVAGLAGPAQQSTGNVNMLLYGRVMIGLLGAYNVWAVYRLYRRVHDSTAGALLAAALLAVCPLLVAQSHYLTVDSTLALMVTLSLWSGLYMMQDGRVRSYLLAGLVFGLTVTTKVNAVIIIASLGLAHVLGTMQRRPGWLKWLLAQPALFGVGGLVGLVIGYPGFVLDSRNFFTNFFMHAGKWVRPRYGAADGFMETPLGDRITWSLGTFTDAIGWEVVILFALGLAIAIYKRNKAAWVVASFPLVYYFTYVLVANRMAERDLPPVVPSLIVLAALAVIWVIRRGVPAKAVAVVAALATLALMFTPFQRSARTSYIYWQGDTRYQARDWMIDTLPEDALIYSEGYAPTEHGLRRKKYMSPKASYYRHPHTFLLHSTTQEDREFYSWTQRPRTIKGRFMKKVPGWFQPIKVFDLKASGPQDLALGRRLFPIFASPTITIYSAHKPRAISQPLPLVHPTRRAWDPYLMSYTNHGAYSLDDASGILTGNGRFTRVLRTPAPLAAAEVEIINLGNRITEVKFSQGPWPGRVKEMFPGQIWRAIVDPIQWPWFVERVYPFTISAYPAQPILMRLITDPLTMGWRALERGQYKVAASHLQRAIKAHPQALLPSALLAAALLQGGDAKAAQKAWPTADDSLEALAKLAESDEPLDKWLEQLAAFTGYYPDLLMSALTRRYRFSYPSAGPVERRAAGPGFQARIKSLEGDEAPGYTVVFNLRDYLPPEALRAEVVLAWNGAITADGLEKAVVRLGALGPGPANGGRKVELKASDFTSPTGRKTLSLDLPPGDPAQRWALHLRVLGRQEIRVESLKVTVDPRALLRSSARWALLTQGRLLLAGGQAGQAAKALGRLAALAPGFIEAFRPQVTALIKVNDKATAAARLKTALPHLAGRPDLLSWGAARAGELGAKEVKAAYDQVLAAHRAPHKVGALFANGLRLRGFDLSARTVKAGGSLKLRLVWAIEGRPLRDISIFTHLVGSGGALNFDHLLAGGKTRMDRGQPGRVVVEELILKIPPKQAPGAYEIEVGLYWNKKRKQITEGPGQGGDILRLGKVEVTSP